MNGRHATVFSDDERQRQVAVMMGTHPRLGHGSAQLRDQTAEVVTMIAQLGLTPIVERPIRLVLKGHPNLRHARHRPNDDYLVSFTEALALTDPPTPFLCTVIDRGVPVFRAPLRQTVSGFGSLNYFSRRRHSDGARVSFSILSVPLLSQQRQQPIATVIEHQFIDDHNNSDAEEGGLLYETDMHTPAELLAFRARNTLGIELLVTAEAALPMTPILPPSTEY